MLERMFTNSHYNETLSKMVKFFSICDRVFFYHHDYYKVILNIASSNVSIFEIHRINHFLSEEGADMSMEGRYKDGVMRLSNTAKSVTVNEFGNEIIHNTVKDSSEYPTINR